MTDLPRLIRRTPAAKAGIVHLGPGAFFRAFGASYTDTVLRSQGGDWGIVAVSLQSDRARRELAPQGGAFTSISLAPDEQVLRVIEAITDVLVLPDDPDAVLDVLCEPSIKVVTLTITEKGYCYTPASGALRMDDAGIQNDLADPLQPQTMPGLLVEALARRRDHGIPPFTVLSCDNLPANGQTTRAAVIAFANARDEGLATWIAEHGRFPSSMVDRITPATTEEVIAALWQDTGYYDPGCVQHEPFSQWVIEDNFVGGERPPWDVAGAQFVSSVEAHEMMKLRCLNGTHSTLAYLGYLAGFETIADAVAEPAFAELCIKLWNTEILPTLVVPEGEDLLAYVAALLARYQNPAIRHRTWQIAMDGSQKLPQRILGTIADNLAQGRSSQGLCLSVAAWMRYVSAVDEQGGAIDVRDPMADKLRSAHDAAKTPDAVVDALLAFEEIFPKTLSSNDMFCAAVRRAYHDLVDHGALTCVRRFVAEA